MTVKKHYDEHLAHFYGWMAGDFDTLKNNFLNVLRDNGIKPNSTKQALDLGAGHGVKSLALSEAGFGVTAVDFNQQLLDELRQQLDSDQIKTVLADIRDVKSFEHLQPELICCCGDTITHLNDRGEIEQLIKDASTILEPEGLLILSFRDYSHSLEDNQRFIPVKSDANRILTCILDYDEENVKVTDLLYERQEDQWVQKVSTYNKVRVKIEEVLSFLEASGLKVMLNEPINRMQTIIAKKVTD
ncbi:MAG: class I SAM-dependent methyltransferase [Bacteroidota bacterium]